VSESIIAECVADFFKITVDELTQARKGGRSTDATISNARHIARYLERDRGLSFEAVGEIYSCDHTSARASFNHMAERLAACDSRYTDPVSAIRGMVRSRLRAAQPVAEGIVAGMTCPTCGAPVIQELQRQIAALNARIDALKGTNEHDIQARTITG
jgi:hypothetical protein